MNDKEKIVKALNLLISGNVACSCCDGDSSYRDRVREILDVFGLKFKVKFRENAYCTKWHEELLKKDLYCTRCFDYGQAVPFTVEDLDESNL